MTRTIYHAHDDAFPYPHPQTLHAVPQLTSYAVLHAESLSRELAAMRHRQMDATAHHDYQCTKLQQLVRHAYETCPYYTMRFNAHGIRPDDIKTPADLPRIPLLSRQNVQTHWYDLCSDTTDISSCYIKQSSGSSGTPIRVVLNYSSDTYAHMLLRVLVEAYGIHPQHFVPWKSGIIMVTAFPESRSITYTQPLLKYSRFYRINIHPNHWASPRDMLDFLVQEQPVILAGFPEHLLRLYEIAHTVERAHEAPIHPHLVISTGNTLHAHDKQVLAHWFQAPVADMYASTEFAYMALSCPSGVGYHCDDSVIIEVVRPDGSQAERGEAGELVITSLRNKEMPLIRYRIGDYGSLNGERCSCGRTVAVLESLQGRTNVMFKMEDGRTIHPFLFLRCLNKLSIAQYQVCQLCWHEVCVKYVSCESDPVLETDMASCISRVLGTHIALRFEPVAHIGEEGRKIQNFVSLVEET